MAAVFYCTKYKSDRLSFGRKHPHSLIVISDNPYSSSTGLPVVFISADAQEVLLEVRLYAPQWIEVLFCACLANAW